MASDQLGPFDLESDTIDSIITRSGPGTYRLGHNDVWGQLSVRFVGRSDDDLKRELRTHAIKKKYTRFTFQLADTVRQAFDRVCRDYHKYRGNGYLDNTKHPYTPENHEYPCPVCKEVKHPPDNTPKYLDKKEKKSSGMVLRMADDAPVVQAPELRPWEMDDEGNKIRKSSGDAAKPWELDHPDWNTLSIAEENDVEQIAANNRNAAAQDANAKASAVKQPSWMSDETMDDEVEPTTNAPAPEKKPWEDDDE